MAESPEPYDIDGNDKPEVPPAPAPSDPAAKPRLFDIPLPPASGEPKGKIEAPKLLDGFEEDADFDKDPELERVITGKDKKPKTVEPVAVAMEDFVKPGLGGPKVWMVAGTVCLVVALVATGVNAENSTFVRVMLMLYNVLLHTGTGVVALFIAATLLKKRLGNFELAASRMFAAVAVFGMMFSFRFAPFSNQGVNSTIVLILASAAYGLLLATLFGLWKKEPLGYVVGSHFGLWLIVAVGSLMTQFVASHPAPKTAAPAEVKPAPVVHPAPTGSAAPK